MDELPYEEVRGHFPFFSQPSNPVFFENAGGSQVPLCVVDGIRDYMLSSYVQLGAKYGLSNIADNNIALARDTVAKLFNAHECGDVIIGNSTTQLLANLANSYSKILKADDEIIVQETCHEANIGPWTRLAELTGANLVWWRIDPSTMSTSMEDLKALISPKTKLLVVTHVSNLLGEILDIPQVVQLAREQVTSGLCKVVVDGVAFAPHSSIDVQAWGVDWYVFSTYKTWGPHMAVMYGSKDAFKELTDNKAGSNHFFIPEDAVPYKFEPGGVNHEGCAGLVALRQYFLALAAIQDQHCERMPTPPPLTHALSSTSSGGGISDGDITSSSGSNNYSAKPQQICGALDGDSFTRETVVSAFKLMAALEGPIQRRLIDYLNTKLDVITIIGPPVYDQSKRVPTISFVHSFHSSAYITEVLHSKGIAMRSGHMYAHRLLTAILPALPSSCSVDDGVVRLSLLHYNTPSEVDKLIEALQEIL